MSELRHLRYFVMVAEEGQITRAAGRLHVAQPALSQSIAQLEARLGVALFVRHARGMTLTPAGEAFLDAARTALTAVADADDAARSHVGPSDRIEWGFIDWPPMIQAPELFAAFTEAHRQTEVCFRELSRPKHTTAAWLAPVDVAICFSPTPHPDVELQPIRSEPRAAVMARSHRLATRSGLVVADVLEETFCGNHPSLEPVRAAFWNLDDHRGSPAHTTADEVCNAHEAIAIIASGRAITTAPYSAAMTFLALMPSVVAIPLRDAAPTVLTLLSHKDRRNPLADVVVAIARSLGDGTSQRSRARARSGQTG
jgi:DNA-binding transcriptional LysR family regulator